MAEEVQGVSGLKFHVYSAAHALTYHNNRSTPNALVIMEAPGRKLGFDACEAAKDVQKRVANIETITLLHRQFSNRFHQNPGYRNQWLPLQIRKFQLEHRPKLQAFFQSIDFYTFPDFFPEDPLGPVTHWYQLKEQGFPVLDYENLDERDVQLKDLVRTSFQKLVQNM